MIIKDEKPVSDSVCLVFPLRVWGVSPIKKCIRFSLDFSIVSHVSPIARAPAKPLIWISYQRDVPRRERERGKIEFNIGFFDDNPRGKKRRNFVAVVMCFTSDLHERIYQAASLSRIDLLRRKFLVCYWNKLKSVAKSPRLVKKESTQRERKWLLWGLNFPLILYNSSIM